MSVPPFVQFRVGRLASAVDGPVDQSVARVTPEPELV